MRTIPALLTLAVGLLVAPAPATAAPVCNLITDPAKDDQVVGTSLGYFDLVGADVAVDPQVKTLSATVRVRDLDLLVTSGASVRWSVDFRVPGTKYLLRISMDAWTTAPGTSTNSRLWMLRDRTQQQWVWIADGRAVWDVAADELRMRVVLDDLWDRTDIRLRKGHKLVYLAASSGLAGFGTYDTATSKAAYTVPAASCIKAEQAFQ